MLATADQLRKYLRTGGTVAGSGGAAIDDELLGLMLAGATSRVEEARPERTLEPLPALEGDPPTDTAEPVELAFTISAPQRVLQVPDLRELVSAELVLDGTAGAQVLDVSQWRLMRRPRELCALWVRFPVPLVVDGELRITGRWGPAGAKLGTPAAELDVNPSVRDAVLVWASRAFHNRTARFADTMQSPAGEVASYFRNLPPDVKLVLDGLEVPGL